jgi:hypothetical protein
MKEFYVSREVSNLITTVFLLGYSVMFLGWICLSLFLGFYVINNLFSLYSGVQEANLLDANLYSSCPSILYFTSDTPNIQTLLVTRFLSGFFSVAPLTSCAGKQLSQLYKVAGKLIILIGVIANVWTTACDDSFLRRSLTQHSDRTHSFWIVCYSLLRYM